MKTTFLSLALLTLPCGAVVAADTAAAEKKETTTPAKPNIQVTGPTSHISSGLASTIQASLPKYQPPPPPPPPEPEEHAAEASPDGATEGEMGTSDQPKNKIIRLPRYVVQADRPPVFKESEVYTKSGLGKLAAARYLSSLDRNVLNRFTLPIIGITPEQRALMMYQENERLENISDLNNDARSALLSGDKAGAEAIKKERDNAFLRSGGMDWTLPKGNN